MLLKKESSLRAASEEHATFLAKRKKNKVKIKNWYRKNKKCLRWSPYVAIAGDSVRSALFIHVILFLEPASRRR